MTENPALRSFQKWHISTFPHLGSPLTARTTTTGPSTHQTVLQAKVELNHERWHYHLTPPLIDFKFIEGCGYHVITQSLSRMVRHVIGPAAPSRAPPMNGVWNTIHQGRWFYMRHPVPSDVPARALLAQALLYKDALSTLFIPFCDFPLSLQMHQDSKKGI